MWRELNEQENLQLGDVCLTTSASTDVLQPLTPEEVETKLPGFNSDWWPVTNAFFIGNPVSLAHKETLVRYKYFRYEKSTSPREFRESVSVDFAL